MRILFYNEASLNILYQKKNDAYHIYIFLTSLDTTCSKKSVGNVCSFMAFSKVLKSDFRSLTLCLVHFTMHLNARSSKVL